jgi:hypothetical protein
MTALRPLTYHKKRRPLTSARGTSRQFHIQARFNRCVRRCSTRAAVRWLKQQGFERIGILGIYWFVLAFLAFTHDEDINVGLQSCVGLCRRCSLKGISTLHVKQESKLI